MLIKCSLLTKCQSAVSWGNKVNKNTCMHFVLLNQYAVFYCTKFLKLAQHCPHTCMFVIANFQMRSLDVW